MRYASIDVLRTVAILLMVVVHFLENLAGVDWALGGFGAPMFGFLVGVSYRIWLDAQVARGRTDEQVTATTVRRGLFLFALGVLFNVAVWLPADTFNWDVLTLIGSAMLLLGMVRDLPPLVPLTISAVVFVLTPVLAARLDYAAYWRAGYFDPDWTVPDVTIGYFVTGYFPVFPWIMFPLVGYVVGGHVLPDADCPDGPTWRGVRPVAVAGACLLLLQLALALSRPYQSGRLTARVLGGWTMFPASVEYVTTVLGVVLLSFALAFWLIDGRRSLDRFPRLLSFARIMSQHSLSIYVLHQVLHLWPLWLYAAFTGREATHYWQRALPWEAAATLSVPCVAVLYFAFRWATLGRRISLESLMRRLCDRPVQVPETAAGGRR